MQPQPPIPARVSTPGSFRFRGAKSRPLGTWRDARTRPAPPAGPGGRGAGVAAGAGAGLQGGCSGPPIPGRPRPRAPPGPAPRPWTSGCCRPWGGSAWGPRGAAAAVGGWCCCGGCPAPARAPWPGKRLPAPGQGFGSPSARPAPAADPPALGWAGLGWGSGESGSLAGALADRSRPEPSRLPARSRLRCPGHLWPSLGVLAVGLCKLLFRANGTCRDASGEMD